MMSARGSTGVYSNLDIKQAVADKHIICHPFHARYVSQASLDVTLGHYYYRVEKLNERTMYNPFDREDVERYFDGPYKAMPQKQWCDLNGLKTLKGIPENHPVIVLAPGERILAHTHEFVGIKPPGACEVRSRSSWGRNGVAVCFDAGWIDPGYINRLTLEIYNLNQHESVMLPVGERIGQIIFHHTGEVDGSYGKGRDKGFSGKYQEGSKLSDLIRTWSPDQLLPKAYLDSRSTPEPIEGLAYD